MDDKFPTLTPLWDTLVPRRDRPLRWLDYGFPEWVAILLLPVVVAMVALSVRELLLVARGSATSRSARGGARRDGLALDRGLSLRVEVRDLLPVAAYLFALLPLGAAVVAVAAGRGARSAAFGAGLVMIVVALSVFAQLATLERCSD